MQSRLVSRAAIAMLLLSAAVGLRADPLLDRLRDSATALKSHDYAKALKISNRVVDEMMETLGPGELESKWFAVAVTHKALALAGLGQNDEAIWQWRMAQNIYPAIAQGDLSPFGAPAEVLKANLLTAEPPPDIFRSGAPAGSSGGKVTAPVVIKKVEPDFPRGAQAFGVAGVLIVECVIGKSGDVRGIRVRKSLQAPTLTYAAMQALRKWKFQPGLLDGNPVDVLFNLTINYKPR